MGPSNVALVNLFTADQKLRAAQARLEAAQRSVRIQERRLGDLSEKSKLAQTTLREKQARAGQLDLELRSRDAHIERLRVQQQTAKNNKEYQAFLIEINTGKVDRAKIEEEAIAVMGSVEKGQTEAAVLETQVRQEKAKLDEMKAQVGDTVRQLESEVDALRPARAAAAAAVQENVLREFERLAEHHEGEALSAISKPDRRREEYLCTACNMELARDVYNKLKTRDEIVFCPSCRRILYIPDHLSPEEALGTGKPTVKKTRTVSPRATRSKSSKAATSGTADDPPTPSDEVTIEPRAKGRLGEVLAKAQGETMRSVNAAGQNPVECEVFIDGDLAGIYKGQTAAHLERAIKYYMGEAAMSGAVEVKPLVLDAEPVEDSSQGEQLATSDSGAGQSSQEPPASS
jgi:hypothetical protein